MERDIDDLSDAPDFLQKVGAIVTEQIQPLQEQDAENRAIILIAVEDNVEDEDGETGCACTFCVSGTENTLSKGLARFLQHDKSQQIIKRAYLRLRFVSLWTKALRLSSFRHS